MDFDDFEIPCPYEITRYDPNHPLNSNIPKSANKTIDFQINIPSTIPTSGTIPPQQQALANAESTNPHSSAVAITPTMGDEHSTTTIATIQCVTTHYGNLTHIILTETGMVSTHIRTAVSEEKKVELHHLQGITAPQYQLLARMLTAMLQQIGIATPSRPLLLSLSLHKLFNITPNRCSDEYDGEVVSSTADRRCVKFILDVVYQHLAQLR